MKHQPPAPESPLFTRPEFTPRYKNIAAALSVPPATGEGHPLRPVDPNVPQQKRAELTGQNARVIAMLKSGQVLTARTAFEFGILRLAARILDCREAGHNITTTTGPGGTAEYRLVKP